MIIKNLAFLCAAAALLSSCAKSGGAPVVSEAASSAVSEAEAETRSEPLGYGEIFDSALSAYFSSPKTGWSESELNRGRLSYVSELDGEIYKFSFEDPVGAFSLLVDAYSGEVSGESFSAALEKDYTPLDGDSAEETVTASALGYFGLETEDAENLSVEYDKEAEPENRWYFVRFSSGGVDYECRIDSAGEFYTSDVDIGVRGSLSLALSDFITHIDSLPAREDIANLILSDECYDMISGRSDENGEVTYSVSFKVGGYGADYLISRSGETLNYSVGPVEGWDKAVAGAFYSAENRIGEHKALEIAINDAEFRVSDLRYTDVLYNDNYGYGFYTVSFGDGEKVYTYEIDAYTGKIISPQK